MAAVLHPLVVSCQHRHNVTSFLNTVPRSALTADEVAGVKCAQENGIHSWDGVRPVLPVDPTTGNLVVGFTERRVLISGVSCWLVRV